MVLDEVLLVVEVAEDFMLQEEMVMHMIHKDLDIIITIMEVVVVLMGKGEIISRMVYMEEEVEGEGDMVAMVFV